VRATNPTVSVIIPCYNLGAYLDQAVQSVLDQTFQDFEIIIIDDGSTDPVTRHLFTSYRRPKTRILRTANQGLAKARNLGIEEARGYYVSCLDADDLLEPDFLQRTVEVLGADQSLAFVSCWLKAFGDLNFKWSPNSCDFPWLLAEDTVCTAALTRRAALVEVGGFDAGMPLPGYEDWDLAISLVERGLRGTVIPEYLFRYRIRKGSMSSSCTEPGNHALLMRYLVEKHAESYSRFLPGVLEAIEQRTLELCAPTQLRSSSDAREAQLIEFLEGTLNLVLRSRSWRFTRPLRRGFSHLKLSARRLAKVKTSPRISVVLTCRDQGRQLPICLDSVKRQLGPRDEIVIVDDGSTDPLTVQMLDHWYRESDLAVIRTEGVGLVRSREMGLSRSQGSVLFALGAEQAVDASYLERAIGVLESDSGIAFVTCGLYEEDTGFVWIPDSASLADLTGCHRVPFPVVRREHLEQAGGYDTSFNWPEQSDWELVLRLSAGGRRGALINEALVTCRLTDAVQGRGRTELLPVVKAVLEKQRAVFESHGREAVLGLENQRRRLQAHLEHDTASLNALVARSISWGDLRRVEPISAVWGIDRGLPIDRYYIGRFLETNRQDIRGRVLEVKDSGYTQTYGCIVECSDVVDIAQDNLSATLISDLSARGSLPEATYDCFILTQTLHIIYEIRNVVENAYRTLRPGGVLLTTLPCVSRIDYESGLEQDQWRFTPGSARRLFEEIFGVGQVSIETHGNVLVCSSFLMGLAAAELTAEELDYHDPYFPLLICVRAVKHPPILLGARAQVSPAQEKAVVLLYHRVDRSHRDRWQLCVSPENFAGHLRCLRRSFRPVRLAEIAAMIADRKVRQNSVAITFDDGYRDNLIAAMPILEQMRLPATFFICGDAASEGESFWWERLEVSLQLMELDDASAEMLHRRLMVADVGERHRILAGLPAGQDTLSERLSHDDLKVLARHPLADIGAHGWSHRRLDHLQIDDLRREVMENVRMLADITGASVRSFAYPFGGSVTSELTDVVREAGIEAACTVGPGAITVGCDPLLIPRLEVRDCDEDKFEARLRTLLEA
jgi:glycosyltransferase involved in cell wall biosynthesis/peptidoglycan/xylan/chitin deacetylase (PgdA/CDA1 family)